MVTLGWFLIGCATGALALIAISFMFAPKLNVPADSQRSKMKDAIKEIELIGSIKYRIEKINEITQLQLSLLSQMDRPSASASHSRYKNEIVRHMKQLEEEKFNIFRSILKDGFDGNINVSIDGKMQSLKISEVIAMYDGQQQQPNPPQNKTDSISPREEKRLRLVINNKGNQDDQAPNPSDPTLH